MSIKTFILKPEEFLKQYNLLAPHITSALDHGTGKTSVLDLTQKILKGSAQCWVVVDGDTLLNVSVTEPIDWEGDTVMHLITTTAIDGEFETFKVAHQELEKFSKEVGCSRIVLWGRSGWAKRLKDFESLDGNKYKQAYVVMSLDLGV